jgi:hypothetical protein
MAFYPLILKPIFIANDLMDIPEKTQLNSGIMVDNTAFINDHKIGGLIKYDPRKDHGRSPIIVSPNQVKVLPTPMLEHFISIFPRQYRYTYDANTMMLSLRGPMTEKEQRQLSIIYNYDTPSSLAITRLYWDGKTQAQFFKRRVYTEEEQDFIKKNQLEINNQVKAGWFLFHHSWMLNPILAINSGASPQSQTLIYGWLSTVSIGKLLQYFGGVDYQTYFKVTYGFYPLYFLVFLTTMYLVFRKMDYLFVGALLLSSGFFALGDQLIRLAPGFNPVRHLFDMVAFLFFYFYMKKKKAIYLYCSFILALFSILWSKDFGIFLLLSVCGATIPYLICTGVKPYCRVLLVCFVGLIGLTLYFLPLHGMSFNVIYMLLGYTVPPTSSSLTVQVLAVISVIYLFYLNFFKKQSPLFFLSLGLFFFLQLEFIYYIWYPSYHHLLNTAPTGVFLVLTWWGLYSRIEDRDLQCKTTTLGFVPLIVLLSIYAVTLGYFYLDRGSYEKISTNHQLYHWNFKHAVFDSTMDPELFSQTMALIYKYEKQPSMYLISKYDLILPVLVHKYNKIPTINLVLDLLSYRDIAKVVNKIQRDRPVYLFIDTDITRSFSTEIIHIADRLARHGHYEESLGRVSALENVRNVYFQIIAFYEPVQYGNLITVYKRKAGV